MIGAVVFDMDGVLIQSEEVWDDVRERLVRERGGRWTESAQADMMGMSSPEWSRYLHEKVGLTDPVTSAIAGLDLANVGYILVGLFVVTWGLSLAVWRFGRIEERWSKGTAS